jgi:hypothetical protein
MGTASLVIGIISVATLGGWGIGALLAILFGWMGMRNVKLGIASNGGVAKAGFILGLVAAGLAILLTFLYVVLVLTETSGTV